MSPTPVTIADAIQVDYGVTTQYYYTVKAIKPVKYNGQTYGEGSIVYQWHYSWTVNVVIDVVNANTVNSKQFTQLVAKTDNTEAYSSTIDLGSSKKLIKAYLHSLYNRYTSVNKTLTITLYGSTDNSSWVDLGSFTNTGSSSFGTAEKEFTSF